jgi:hypothetical protein
MHAVAQQRCLNHATREAVARCPECGQFYCRECITEHDDRVICAACLKKLADASTRPARRVPSVAPLASALGGITLTFLFFYITGRLLVALPDEYHEGNLWKLKIFKAFNPDDE